jgi:DNA-binding response OmpR family regulator
VERRDAFRDGGAVKRTTREFDLLLLFARPRDQTLASRWIIENVWGYAAALGTKALAVQIGRLRRTIEMDCHQPRLIRSIRGFGYQLVTGGP